MPKIHIFHKLKSRMIRTCFVICLISLFVVPTNILFAQTFNKQINYQGKLTNSSGVAVTDGDYNLEFKIYTASSGGSAVWTESRTVANRVTVTNGMFSVMLGEVTPITSIDWNQTLYLGVNVGGSGLVAIWDGEMTPRKVLGSVPSAFQSDKLDDLDSTQFVRSDAVSTIAVSSADTALSINQTGAGNLVNFQASGTSIFSLNNAGLASTSALKVSGNATVGTLTATGLTSVADVTVSGGITLGGVYMTTWPAGGGSTGYWATTTNNLIGYPSLAGDYAIVVGAAATTSDHIKFEVLGNTKLGGDLVVTGNATSTGHQYIGGGLSAGSFSTNPTTGNTLIGTLSGSASALLTVSTSTGTGNNPVVDLISSANRPTLKVSNSDGLASTYVIFDVNGDNLNDKAFGSSYLSEGYNRFAFDITGKMEWGTGAGARDTVLYRSGVGALATNGSLSAEYFTSTSTTVASTFPYASTTALTVSGNAYLGSLTGPLQAINGLVSASSTLSVAYGGTGATTFTSNGILYGNGTSALQATAAGTNNYLLYSNNGTPAWTNTPTILGTNITGLSADNISAGTLSIARGGTGQTTFAQGWLSSDGSTITSSTSPTVNYITATSTTATSTFAGGLTVDGNTLVVDYAIGRVGIASSSPSAYLSISPSSMTTNVDAPLSIAAYGATGFTTVEVGDTGRNGGGFLFNAGAGGDSQAGPGGIGGGINLLAGTGGNALAGGEGGTGGSVVISAGSSGTGVANGSGGTVTINAGLNFDRTLASNILLATNGGKVGIGTTSPYASLSVSGQTVALYYTATSTSQASTFPYASTTALTVSGTSYLGTVSSGVWNGTTIAVNKGGTGLASYTIGDLIYASGATSLGKLSDVATGGILVSGGVGSAPSWIRPGQGWLHADGTNTITSSTSPTVNYLTATSTTATSTFAGGLTVDGNTLVVDYSSGKVGVGTTPTYNLDVSGLTSTELHLSGTGNGADDGLYFVSNGADNAGISMGARYNGSAWVAKSTEAVMFGGNNGEFSIHQNSSLTPGSTFVPTERFLISSTGNVGISTSTPYGKLVINGTEDNSYVKFLSDGVSDSSVAKFFIQGARTNAFNIYSDEWANDVLNIDTDSGLISLAQPTAVKVGIGTSNPLSKLEVNGGGVGATTTIRIDTGSTDNDGSLEFWDDTTVQLKLFSERLGNPRDGIRSYSSDRFVIEAQDGDEIATFITGGSNNVGIGTTSPYAKLSVVGETVSNYFTATSTTATSSFRDVSVVGRLSVLQPTTNALIIGNTTGNTRGGGAVDIQSARGLVTQVASGVNATALGINNTASSTYNTALGYGNAVGGFSHNTAVGSSNNVYTNYFNVVGHSSAFGYGNTIGGGAYYSGAFGYMNNVSGYGGTSYALGNNNTVSVPGSYVFGGSITNDVGSSLMIGPSNTAKLTITGTPRMGFGTTTPIGTFQLASTANTKLTLTDTNAALDTKHWYLNSNDGIFSIGRTPDALTSDSPVVTISATENVGIGRAVAGSKLDVLGDIRFGNDTNGTGYLASGFVGTEVGLVGDSDDYIAVKDSSDSSYHYGANNLIVTNGGSVGIGITPAGSRFQVNGPRWVGNTNYQGLASLYSTDTLGANVGAGLILGGTYSGSNLTEFAQITGVKSNATSGNYDGDLTFLTRVNGSVLTEKMRVTSAGNVGIGTVSPRSALDVVGTTALSWGTDPESYGLATIGSKGTGGSLWVHTPSIYPGGSYESGLGVDGSYASMVSTVNLKAYGVKYDGYGSNLAFSVSSGTTLSEAMRIVANKNVGIGTTTPSSRLDVYYLPTSADGTFTGASSDLVFSGTTGAPVGRAQYNKVYSSDESDGSMYGTYSESLGGNYGYGVYGNGKNADTVYGGYFLGTGNAGTYQANGIYASASGGSNTNWAGYFNAGNVYIANTVGIGTTAPNEGKVEVKGGSVCVDTNSDGTASSCIANESDERLKKNVDTLSGSLDKILSLRGVEFDWKVGDEEVEKHYPLINRFAGNPHSVGLIAQEVEKILPEAIMAETVGDGVVQYKQLDYDKFIPLLIEGMKEQQVLIKDLASNIDSYKKLSPNIEDGKLILANSLTLDLDTGHLSLGAGLDLNNTAIENIKSLNNSSGNWSLTEDGVLVVNEVRTKTLCLDDLCIDKQTLKNILDQLGLSAVSGVPTPPPATSEINSDPDPMSSTTDPVGVDPTSDADTGSDQGTDPADTIGDNTTDSEEGDSLKNSGDTELVTDDSITPIIVTPTEEDNVVNEETPVSDPPVLEPTPEPVQTEVPSDSVDSGESPTTP